MVINFLLKKRTNPTPYSLILYFEKENNPPTQPHAFIIPYSNMKLLKTPNNLITRISLMQFSKIETTTHGCVDMAHTQTCTNETTSWLVCSWNTFGAWMNHGQTRTHRGLDLGETTTFPLIVFSMPASQTCPLFVRVLLQHLNNMFNVQCWYNHRYDVKVTL